jgi:rSAM/selenodomain-associated transferase 1
MAACIIVFVKNPVPGQVKTRLIPYLSPEQAASLYQTFLIDWCNALSTISTAHRVIAYTPPEGLNALQTLIGEDPVYIPQVGASLGERLIAAARWACDQEYTKFLFVGSDSPTLPTQYVERALDLLESRDIVIGPSVDGGYYLIGFSKRGASLSVPTIFEGIAWSTEVVFRQTLGKIQEINTKLSLLPPWYDVDTPAGLQILRDHLFGLNLAGENNPAPQTYRKLREWL